MNLIDEIQSVDVLDHNDLLKRCMGNRQFALRIVEAFERQLVADLDELDQAVATEDAAEIAVIAHRIKGACSNVSARRLQQLALRLGELATSRDMVEIRRCGPHLRKERERFHESLALIQGLIN